MQHLGSARFHAGAQSGGENDYGYGRLHHFYYRGAGFSPMPLSFPKTANPAQIVGRTPGPRGSPWTRFSPNGISIIRPGKPTRASAADQGSAPQLMQTVRY